MRNISFNVNDRTDLLPGFVQHSVGAGRANELLRKAALSQLDYVHKYCGFRYVRFHGLLSDDMGVYFEDSSGDPVLNFQYIDMVYDEIIKIGMKPFVELSFMPDALASGSKTVFWWKGNVTPPKDYSKWHFLIKELTGHWIRRYGPDEVRTWYFEVWNEPNHPAFFSSDINEYFRLYAETAKAVKSVDSALRVGGPATAGNAWVKELISFCIDNSVPLDFISTHHYSTVATFDEYGTKQIFLSKTPDSIAQAVRRVKNQILESPMPDLPLFYTEWSTSPSSRDPVHDSYIEAPFILYNLKRIGNCADSMSYWTFTDIFEEGGIARKPFHGGFGLLNMQSIKKSAFYAYRYFAELGKQQLECDDSDSFVCIKPNGDVQVLLWNYKLPEQNKPNSEYFSADLPPEKSDPVRISVNGLPQGDYTVKCYRTGYGICDPYTEYIKKGMNDCTDYQCVDSLKTDSDMPLFSEFSTKVEVDGLLTINTDTNMYDCILYKIIKN